MLDGRSSTWLCAGAQERGGTHKLVQGLKVPHLAEAFKDFARDFGWQSLTFRTACPPRAVGRPISQANRQYALSHKISGKKTGPAWADLEAASTATHGGRRGKARAASISLGFVGAACSSLASIR